MAAGSPPSRGPEPARRPVALPLVAGANLPLGFIGVGLGALAVAVFVLGLAPTTLLLPSMHPRVVALAHLWLPGFLLSVSLGAIYQLMPVVLGAPLRLPLAWTWAHLGLHAGGVALLVGGFFTGRLAFAAMGGTLVSLGTVVSAVAVWRTFGASTRRDAVAWSFPLAASWLVATTLFGVGLALNRRTPFLPLSVLDLLRAHAHVGLAGFFVTLLQGATFQLVPMFTLSELRAVRRVRAGLLLTQPGLVALTLGLAGGGRGFSFAGAGALLAGLGCSGSALVATLRGRRRRVLEPGVTAFVTGAGGLAGAAVIGVALMLIPGERLPLPASSAYGVMLVAGALGLMVLGMLAKILPFLVWMKVYGPRTGREPVPLASALGSDRLERIWLGGHAVAVVTLVAGLMTEGRGLVLAGAWLLAGSMGAFLGHAAAILGHVVTPRPGAAPRRTIEVPAT